MKTGLCVLLWIAAAAVAAPDVTRLQPQLEKYAGLDRGSVKRLQAGRVLAKLLQTPESSEVAVLGAVFIAVPSQYFLKRFREISTFMKGPGISECIGSALRTRFRA